MYYRLLLGLLILFGSCTTTDQTAKRTKDKNNLAVEKDTNTVNKGKDEVIFEGTNNVFEVIKKNSAYFDNSKDVIVIKGNNNHITLYNVNVVELDDKARDTLTIVGNKQKYVMDMHNNIDAPKNTGKTDTLEIPERQFLDTELENLEKDFAGKKSEKVYLDYFDRKVPVDSAYEHFSDEVNRGKPEGYYQLGQMYHYGIGIESSIDKAIEMYEHAAMHDHIGAIRTLGDLYANNKNETQKARYYFNLGVQLDDSYCRSRLKEVNGNIGD